MQGLNKDVGLLGLFKENVFHVEKSFSEEACQVSAEVEQRPAILGVLQISQLSPP